MYVEEDKMDAVFGADAWCHGSALFSERPTFSVDSGYVMRDFCAALDKSNKDICLPSTKLLFYSGQTECKLEGL